MVKLQYLDEYLQNVSQITAEDIASIPEAKYEIDYTKFEHALNRHYQLFINLAMTTEKARQNEKIYTLKQLPAATCPHPTVFACGC